MKTFTRNRVLRALAPLALALPLLAGSAPASAETVQTNYAQLLADFALFSNLGVTGVEIHATVPGEKEATMLASSAGPKGARSGAAILKVIASNAPTVTGSGNARQVTIPLRTATDQTIGALVLTFAHKPGQSDENYLFRAADIRNRLKEITPKVDTMFDPYTKGYSATDTMAQRINQILLERHPDINVVAIHVTKPGDKTNKVWGINRPNFIGRDSDEIDTDTEKTGRIVMQVIPATHRMEVHMPLMAPDGTLIGTLCTVYFWHDLREAGDLYGRSLGIMEEARLLTPANRDDLFKP